MLNITSFHLCRPPLWISFVFCLWAHHVLHAQRTLVEWTFPDAQSDVYADGGLSWNAERRLKLESEQREIEIREVSSSTAPGADTASAHVAGWHDGATNKYWKIRLASTGYQGLLLSSRQRSSNTGPRDFKVQFRTGNAEWIDVPSGHVICANNFTQGVLESLPLPPEADDVDDLAIRWVAVGTNSVGGGPVASVGVSSIDDIRVQGYRQSVPIPQMLAPRNLRSDGFTARWLPVMDATGYAIDVATNAGFRILETLTLVDMEGPGESKTTYAADLLSLGGLAWELDDVLTGTSPADWKTGQRSLRFRGTVRSSLTLQEDLPNGLAYIAFQYHRYGSDEQVDWQVEVSDDEGVSWNMVGETFRAVDTDIVQIYSNRIEVIGPVRIRIVRSNSSEHGNARMNIDNLELAAFNPVDSVPGWFSTYVEGPSIHVSGLENRVTYYYRVRALDAGVSSDYSMVMTIRTSDNPPGFLMFSR